MHVNVKHIQNAVCSRLANVILVILMRSLIYTHVRRVVKIDVSQEQQSKNYSGSEILFHLVMKIVTLVNT